MGISGSGFYFENTIINGQETYIESTTTQIEDEYISFSFSFFVQSVSNSSSGGFINDSQYV